jgi:hypothetical protein
MSPEELAARGRRTWFGLGLWDEREREAEVAVYQGQDEIDLEFWLDRLDALTEGRCDRLKVLLPDGISLGGRVKG